VWVRFLGCSGQEKINDYLCFSVSRYFAMIDAVSQGVFFFQLYPIGPYSIRSCP
jgi:hypothetical protein